LLNCQTEQSPSLSTVISKLLNLAQKRIRHQYIHTISSSIFRRLCILRVPIKQDHSDLIHSTKFKYFNEIDWRDLVCLIINRQSQLTKMLSALIEILWREVTKRLCTSKTSKSASWKNFCRWAWHNWYFLFKKMHKFCFLEFCRVNNFNTGILLQIFSIFCYFKHRLHAYRSLKKFP
jgi:hypothetical protein